MSWESWTDRQIREAIAASASEDEVRRIVADVNARIVEVNSRVTAGPPSSLAPLDPERTVERWRARRRSPSDG